MWSIADVKFRRYINNLELAVLMSCSTNTDEFVDTRLTCDEAWLKTHDDFDPKSIRKNIHSEHLTHSRTMNTDSFHVTIQPDYYDTTIRRLCCN